MGLTISLNRVSFLTPTRLRNVLHSSRLLRSHFSAYLTMYWFPVCHFRCMKFKPLVIWIWNQNIAISTIVGTSAHISKKYFATNYISCSINSCILVHINYRKCFSSSTKPDEHRNTQPWTCCIPLNRNLGYCFIEFMWTVRNVSLYIFTPVRNVPI
jgi:hypothetical protein